MSNILSYVAINRYRNLQDFKLHRSIQRDTEEHLDGEVNIMLLMSYFTNSYFTNNDNDTQPGNAEMRNSQNLLEPHTSSVLDIDVIQDDDMHVIQDDDMPELEDGYSFDDDDDDEFTDDAMAGLREDDSYDVDYQATDIDVCHMMVEHYCNAHFKLLHMIRDRANADSVLWFEMDDMAKLKMETGKSGSRLATAPEQLPTHDFPGKIGITLMATCYRFTGGYDLSEQNVYAIKKDTSLDQHYADLIKFENEATDHYENTNFSTKKEDISKTKLARHFVNDNGYFKSIRVREGDRGPDQNWWRKKGLFMLGEEFGGEPLSLQIKKKEFSCVRSREPGTGSAKMVVERVHGAVRQGMGPTVFRMSDFGSYIDSTTGMVDEV